MIDLYMLMLYVNIILGSLLTWQHWWPARHVLLGLATLPAVVLWPTQPSKTLKKKICQAAWSTTMQSDDVSIGC